MSKKKQCPTIRHTHNHTAIYYCVLFQVPPSLQPQPAVTTPMWHCAGRSLLENKSRMSAQERQGLLHVGPLTINDMMDWPRNNARRLQQLRPDLLKGLCDRLEKGVVVLTQCGGIGSPECACTNLEAPRQAKPFAIFNSHFLARCVNLQAFAVV
jgi:hypothetical protein